MMRTRTERSGAGATGDDLFGHSRRLSASWWPGARCQDICNQNGGHEIKIGKMLHVQRENFLAKLAVGSCNRGID